MLGWVLAALLHIQIPANAPGKAGCFDFSTCSRAAHVGDPSGEPGIWRVSQHMEDPSSDYFSFSSKNKNEY